MFRYLIHKFIIKVVEGFGGGASIVICNLFSRLMSSKIRFKRIADNNSLCEVTEFYTDRERLSHCYHLEARSHIYLRGISRRGSKIAHEYGIDRIKFEAGDLIIEAGSNSGDLLIYLAGVGVPLEIHCFEPDPCAFGALKINCSKMTGANAVNFALSNICGEANLYLSTLGGDSSLSEPESYTDKILMECITLDEYIEKNDKLNHRPIIKLFKLEAEGFEPEVIMGAINSLGRILYIAADLGWERGIAQECTIPQVTNLLLNNGFELEHVNKDGIHYLFKNKSMESLCESSQTLSLESV